MARALVVNQITELIGNTPVVRLQRLTGAGHSEVLVKLECFNPSGSVKDRAAYHMLLDAERKGRLRPGGTVIEATSGNTGIGLAMNCAVKGYRCVIVMPDNASSERIQLLKAYGAKVVLTRAAGGMKGALDIAGLLHAEFPGSFMPGQFENAANPDIHRRTTAVEIAAQTDSKLDAFVACAGTGGTITGTGETLRSLIKGISIYVVEPQGSPVLSGGNPGPNRLTGTGPGFIPAVLNTAIYDEIIQVADEDALSVMRLLARSEGLLVGPSSGAAVWAGMQIAKKLGPHKKVLCIAPDSGERYLSMDFF
ncbi:cysteine synthase A [Paenibacillus sp. S150]|uniref:cysteine synthase A n=1 Tax=Paenibacillus sp. S150 TaxID=2749826 RepID=UPI001C570C3A|nr:cysteine synthase A [Paenibacillus sp. S150]MBW4080698.1 cysteine synthase A [Paenibacillus sp. S150]